MLELEKQATYNLPNSHMVTVIGKFKDGRPASKALVYCDGWWRKFVDTSPPENQEPVPRGPRYPFYADSRGAMIFNPDFDEEEPWIRCYMEKDGLMGTGKIYLDQGAKLPLTLNITLDSPIEGEP